MPRGVYDRSKFRKKSKAEAAPIAAKAASKVQSRRANTDSPGEVKLMQPGTSGLDSYLAFNILGANLTTLTSAFSQVVDKDVHVAKALAKEIEETVKLSARLRGEVFGHLEETPKIEKYEAAAVEAVPEKPALVSAPMSAMPPVSPVATAPTLPHGNASFVPPMPPIPHH